MIPQLSTTLPIYFGSDVLESAVALHALGFAPVFADGKRPLTRGWQKSTPTADDLRSQYRPGRNVGLSIRPWSGRVLVCVDVDDDARLGVLTDTLGPLPATLTGRSSRGDRRFYTLPVGDAAPKNITGLALPSEPRSVPGVDVKSTGGFVVVAPSIHPDTGEPYTWTDARHPVDLPPEWRIALNGVVPDDEPIARSVAEYTPLTLREHRGLHGKTERAIKNYTTSTARALATAATGTRNTTAFHAALGVMRRALAYRRDDLERYIADALVGAGRACGMTEAESRTAVTNGIKTAKKHPGNVTLRVLEAHGATDFEPNPCPLIEPESPAFTWLEPEPESPKLGLDLLTTQDGSVDKCQENLNRIFARHPHWVGRLRMNDLEMKPEVDGGELDDAAVRRALGWLDCNGLRRCALESVEGAMRLACVTYNPVTTWLDSLPVWDGVPRLDTWARDYLGVADTPLLRAMASKWLISAVARAYVPGCQADAALILAGPQGAGKSSALRVLFGGWCREAMFSDRSARDQGECVDGAWLVCFDEMAGTSGRNDTLKNFITRTDDVYRPAYARTAVKRLRRCVFAGTTNEVHFLDDATGGRRFWPMLVTRTDVAGLQAARESIFAEAVARYRSGEPWWLSGALEAEATLHRQDSTAEDPWALALRVILSDPKRPWLTASDLCLKIMDGTFRALPKDVKRVHATLKHAPWAVKSKRRGEWGYSIKDDAAPLCPTAAPTTCPPEEP
jgi:hypothetical protein